MSERDRAAKLHPNRTSRITEAEARAAVVHFANRHFNNPGRKSRASIPAHQDDDDILLMAYITQREAELQSVGQACYAKAAQAVREIGNTRLGTFQDAVNAILALSAAPSSLSAGREAPICTCGDVYAGFPMGAEPKPNQLDSTCPIHGAWEAMERRDTDLPIRVRELVRTEMMRSMSDRMSMDEIANVAYAVETALTQEESEPK